MKSVAMKNFTKKNMVEKDIGIIDEIETKLIPIRKKLDDLQFPSGSDLNRIGKQNIDKGLDMVEEWLAEAKEVLKSCLDQ